MLVYLDLTQTSANPWQSVQRREVQRDVLAGLPVPFHWWPSDNSLQCLRWRSDVRSVRCEERKQEDVAGEDSRFGVTQEHGGFANPLFRLSSAPLANFAVHYGSGPLLGYHLADVFDDTTVGTSAIAEHLAAAAKSQFFQWCESFRQHVQLDTVKLHFHCGEAISLCYALQQEVHRHSSMAQSLHCYARPWCSVLLRLDAYDHLDACGPFDVIDTSDISDHVGVLNLMPATVPLSGNKLNSVLYVETLLQSSNETSDYLPTI